MRTFSLPGRDLIPEKYYDDHKGLNPKFICAYIKLNSLHIDDI